MSSNLLLLSTATLGSIFGLLVWLVYKRCQGKHIPIGVLGVLSCLLLLNAAVTYFVLPKEDSQAYKQLTWQQLQPEQIPAWVAKGKTVFVDVSADWCNICKANKDRVLHQAVVVERLKDKNILLMRGDLTQSDARIEAYLARYQAYGVPFNIVYSQAHPTGLVLPRVLSIDDLLTSLPPRSYTNRNK
ncbi:thioredoxin family protein [Shewanella sp. Isolate7]|uniref:thioredoxin family protein n=1 Tax=Shewanella sp. Isolate7 TaxID=2908528 RepID=UPI001EFCF3AE|nr:thioredoxin family protein [Shewanella sp. Isolate7]MCG9722645.1 thioredoxin family protein [Shewanella sp. Isolate7]